MSEALWLADFVTRFDLPTAVKKHILKRIKSLGDGAPQIRQQRAQTLPPHIPANLANQSPSTIANMLKAGVIEQPLDIAPIEPVAIATTPATAAALNSRNAAIKAAASAGAFTGKPEPGRTSPRKF